LPHLLTAGVGTNLPIRNVRFHGESWRVSGRATEIAKATFMTRNYVTVFRTAAGELQEARAA